MKRIAVAALTILFAGSMPLRPQAQSPAPGAIEGSVIRAGSNQPLAGAEVTLVRSNVPSTAAIALGTSTATVVMSATTDGAGKFLIPDVSPGSYQLTAAHNGFARQEFGQKASFHAGTLIQVSAGQKIQDLVFRLVPTGSVTGRISDSNGQPLQGMNVQLLRPSYDSDGRKTLRLVANAITNDLGEYRLYWITPGRYYMITDASRSTLEMELRNVSSGVVAGMPGAQIEMEALRRKNEVVDQGYAATYYPGVADASRAVAIEVRPDAEISGTNLTVPRLQRFRVSGNLVDGATGQPTGRNAGVYIEPMDPSAPGLPGVSFSPATGTFEVRDVPPGAYVVVATALSANPSATPSSTIRLRLDLTDHDVSGLQIPIRYGTAVTGRVDVEGLAAVSSLTGYERIVMRLASTLTPQSGMVTSGKIAANGSFTFENVPAGDYRIHVAGLPPDAFVKSASAGLKDLLQFPLSVGTVPPDPVAVLLSPNAAQIAADIVDRNQIPVPGIQAVLIPDQDRDRHDLFKTAISDPAGHVVFQGITPGDYKLFAWEDLEPYSYFDPDVLQKYTAEGKAIRLAESSKETVTVAVIPVSP